MFYNIALLRSMAIGVVEFTREGYKIRKKLLQINCSQMKLLNFGNLNGGKLSKIGHHFRKYSALEIDGIKKCVP